MISHQLWLALVLVGSLMLEADDNAQAMPSSVDVESAAPTALDEDLQTIKMSQAQPAQPPSAQSAPVNRPEVAQNSNLPSQTTAEPIGNVVTLTGIATVIRNKNSLSLHLRDDILLNDTVQTSSSSALGITFNDATTFNLYANAKITIDSYVYEEGGKQNSGIFDIGKGTVGFVAAAVAKTGDMKINTPTSTLGIRGTTGLVEVPEGAAAGANNVNVKLYPDADGHVGRIEVNDRTGVRLGALTKASSGLTIRPGVGGARPSAVPLTISQQQATRDQGVVRQLHAAQNVGRQIVNEQRAARRANPPPTAPNRGNQPPGPQRQNQLPGQPRPGAPNRQGQQQPRTPQQGGQPARAGQNANPQPRGQGAAPERQGQSPSRQQGGQRAMPPEPSPQPRQGALPPRVPGVQRPSGPGGPALLRPRPPGPKGKGERKKR